MAGRRRAAAPAPMCQRLSRKSRRRLADGAASDLALLGPVRPALDRADVLGCANLALHLATLVRRMLMPSCSFNSGRWIHEPQTVCLGTGTSARELRACCRPTETGAGPSDARIAAAASHCTGVFLPCAWCLELSRNLENPYWIRRRRDRPLCAPQAVRTRVSAPQARAHFLLVCPASSCSAITATAVQPSSTAHCGIGRTETRV